MVQNFKNKSSFVIFSLALIAPSFIHASPESDFVALLTKVKKIVPENLPNYQSSSIEDGVAKAVGNVPKTSTVKVDLDAKTILVKVVNPPRKEGVREVQTKAFLENGKVWVEQKFVGASFANVKMPVTVSGNTLRASEKDFQYLDAAGAQKIKGNLTFDMHARAKNADYEEVKAVKVANLDIPATEYSFVFGLDESNKGIFMDQEIKNLVSREKDVADLDDQTAEEVNKAGVKVPNVAVFQSRIALTPKAQSSAALEQ